MKIAYCSDLHLDFYFSNAKALSERKFRSVFDKYFEDLDSEHLIVAGDVGHHPMQNLEILKMFQSIYSIKNIITVQGNHEGYRVSNSQRAMFPSGLHKIAYQMDLFEANGITALDGTSVEIDGITIGGANSFYDGSIYFKQTAGWYSSSGGIDSYWKRTMNDHANMKLDDFMMYSKQEKDKLLKLKDTCDIIVTHVKPVIEDRFIHPDFKGELSNCFYTFDWGDNVFSDTKLKYWVYGHTHSVEEYNFADKTLLCNPYGYPKENLDSKIRHLEI